MKKAQKISRIILSIGLSVLVYTETGIWTSIAIMILLLGMEGVASSVNKIRAHVLNMDRIDMREAAEKIIGDIIVKMQTKDPNIPLSESEKKIIKKQFEKQFNKDNSSTILKKGEDHKK